MLKNLNETLTLLTLTILVIMILRFAFSLYFPPDEKGENGRFLDHLRHYRENEED
ncbi:MAG: hypothetical protein IIZ47_05225 [Erysipelotrichaceae bacterium]|nr:hypothetical protein [Erysipelotrichaceae bacterium]